MRLEFDFPDEWASSMPATGVAIVAFLDSDGEMRYGTGHLVGGHPSIAETMAMGVWFAEDAKRQLMADPPYDDEDE